MLRKTRWSEPIWKTVSRTSSNGWSLPGKSGTLRCFRIGTMCAAAQSAFLMNWPIITVCSVPRGLQSEEPLLVLRLGDELSDARRGVDRFDKNDHVRVDNHPVGTMPFLAAFDQDI